MRGLIDGQYLFASENVNLTERLNQNMHLSTTLATNCEVTFNAGLTVDVDAGDVTEGNAITVITGVSKTHDAEAVMDIRFDLIVVDSTADTVNIVKGLINNRAPEITAGYILLAIVGIEKDAIAIDPNLIFDCRLFKNIHNNIQHTEDYISDAEEGILKSADGTYEFKVGLNVIASGTGTGLTAGSVLDVEVDDTNPVFAPVNVTSTPVGDDAPYGIQVVYAESTNANKMNVRFLNTSTINAIDFQYKIVQMDAV